MKLTVEAYAHEAHGAWCWWWWLWVYNGCYTW